MIRRKARQSSLTDVSAGAVDSYTRRYRNFTGVPIEVMDGNGATLVIPPAPGYVTPSPDKQFEIIEYYIDCKDETLNGMPIEREPEARYRRTDAPVSLITRIPYHEIAESNASVYVATANISVRAPHLKTPFNHPVVDAMPTSQLKGEACHGIIVELLDPEKKYNNYYMNLGGQVAVVRAVRTPYPTEDGVRITVRDSVTDDVISNVYSLEKLTQGPGVQGIRFYVSRVEAEEDARRPDNAEYEKQKADFNTRRSEYEKHIRDDEAEKQKTYYENKQREENRKYEERIKKLEEENHRRHKERVKDKSTLWSGIIKVVSTVVDFVKALF